MSVVNKIKLPNNTTVDINDARDVIIGDGVENVVTLTSAEYEALSTKDPDTIYVVTDVSGAVQFVSLTMAQYEALSTKDPNTLYIVTDVSGAVQFVALTTAQYEALSTKDSNTLYIITDASGGGGGGSGISDVTLGGTSVVTNNVAVLPAYPTTLPASDVSSWAKASTKPTYTASEVGALPSSTVIPTVPTISTSITSDASSDTKTASPKAVKTYVDGIVGDIETLLAAI